MPCLSLEDLGVFRNIAFLKDDTFKDLSEQFDLNGHFLGSKIEVKNVTGKVRTVT